MYTLKMQSLEWAGAHPGTLLDTPNASWPAASCEQVHEKGGNSSYSLRGNVAGGPKQEP